MTLLAAVILAASTRSTPPPPPTATPTPPQIAFAEAPAKELDELAVFEGTWSCERTSGDAPLPARYEMTLRRDPDGFWYSGSAVEPVSAENPRPATRRFYWGHDAVVGKFVGGWLDSRGGWMVQTSMGWEQKAPDKLVFLGHLTATGAKLMARETYTRPRDGAFDRTTEVLGFTEWAHMSTETCRRVP